MVIQGQTILIWVICNSNTNNDDTFPSFFTLLKSIVLKHIPLHKSVKIKLNLACVSNIGASWLFLAWCIKREGFSQRISCSKKRLLLLLLLLVFKSMVSNSGHYMNFWNCLPGEKHPIPFSTFFFFFPKGEKNCSFQLSFWTMNVFCLHVSVFFSLPPSLCPRQGK